ncbi:hypothetical protein PR048_022403 [Dryococelus australis]|uniref:Uncharacterized protein n=1 Tax=Dryococelus australis TaxID=614101 RepID=A0ABQ9H174_9NEOP|nr:hypothetical protein PR048_022403 [Dryococelus australis]
MLHSFTLTGSQDPPMLRAAQISPLTHSPPGASTANNWAFETIANATSSYTNLLTRYWQRMRTIGFGLFPSPGSGAGCWVLLLNEDRHITRTGRNGLGPASSLASSEKILSTAFLLWINAFGRAGDETPLFFIKRDIPSRLHAALFDCARPTTYAQSDQNSARQFRALHLAAMAHFTCGAVSSLSLPRFLASNAKKKKKKPPVRSKVKKREGDTGDTNTHFLRLIAPTRTACTRKLCDEETWQRVSFPGRIFAPAKCYVNDVTATSSPPPPHTHTHTHLGYALTCDPATPPKAGDICPVAPTSSPIRDRMILVPNQNPI